MCALQTIINEQIAKTENGNEDANTDKLPHAQLKVKRGSSSEIVEMAIMSMYGIIPNFNIRNIGDFLELAEHLKIKELKDYCIDWINDIDCSEINCIHVFHLSRKYKIEITNCIDYIESHIPETFLNADAVDLPTVFVGYLFTDVKFSYVDMDTKLNFLVKLANKQYTGSTQETIVQLFKTLDLKEISAPTWEYAKSDINFSRMVNLGNKVRSIDRTNLRICVMIIPFKEDYFACLDLQNDSWYRLNSDYFERYSCDEQNILGIRNNNPEVYFRGRYCCGEYLALTSVDLESDQIRRHSIELLDFDNFINYEILKEDITHVNFINNTLIAILKKTIRLCKNSVSCESESESELKCFCSYQRKEEQVDNINDTNEAVQAQVPPEIIPDTSTGGVCCTIPTPGITVDEPSTSGLSTSDCERECVTIVTDVFVGNTSEEEEEHDDDDEDAEEIEMKPLFSFCKEKITQICINDLSILALLTKSGGLMYVILYDLLQFKMERVLSMDEGKYELCATNNGFLLHNDSYCYCFTKTAQPIFSGNYKREKFMLENKEYCFVKYHYQGGFWMRILRRSIHNDIELQYISHEDLTVCYASFDVYWKNISMPKDEHLLKKVMNFENIFIVPLSKRMLRCNIACPHCKYYSELC